MSSNASRKIFSAIAWALAIVAAGAMLFTLTVPVAVNVSTQDPRPVVCTPVLGTDPAYRLGVRDTGGNGMTEVIGGCSAARDRSLGVALVLGLASTGLVAAVVARRQNLGRAGATG